MTIRQLVYQLQDRESFISNEEVQRMWLHNFRIGLATVQQKRIVKYVVQCVNCEPEWDEGFRFIQALIPAVCLNTSRRLSGRLELCSTILSSLRNSITSGSKAHSKRLSLSDLLEPDEELSYRLHKQLEISYSEAWLLNQLIGDKNVSDSYLAWSLRNLEGASQLFVLDVVHEVQTRDKTLNDLANTRLRKYCSNAMFIDKKFLPRIERYKSSLVEDLVKSNKRSAI